MCQLTLVNINQKQLTKLCLAIQMTMNTRISHQDGAGIAFKEEEEFYFIKSEKAPFEDEDFNQTFIKPISEITPVIAHVRLATNKKDTISEEKSHPFYNKKAGLILAHNGTLTFKDDVRQENIEKEFPGMIDSEIFLEVLGKFFKRGKKKNLVKALKETMKLFNGKFAFLIINLNNQEIFVVRGSSATLFKSEVTLNGKFYGYIINTERKDLKDAMAFISNTWGIYNKAKIKFSEPEIVKAGTINRVTSKELVELDSISETRESYYPKATAVGKTPAILEDWRKKRFPLTTPTSGTNMKTNSTAWDTLRETSTKEANSYKLATNKMEIFRKKYFLTIPELDHLLWHCLGSSLYSVTSSDVRDIHIVLDPLFEAYVEETGGRTQKKAGLVPRFKLWDKIHRNKGLLRDSSMLTYELFNLQFPYFLNSYDELHRVEVITRKEKREETT